MEERPLHNHFSVRADAISVYRLPQRSRKNREAYYQEWMSTSMGDFQGNVEHAGTLLAGFHEGRTYVYSRLRQKGLKINRLHIAVVEFKNPNHEIPSFYHNRTNHICIDKDSLREFSLFNPETVISATEAFENSVAYVGSIHNFFRLGGVEETHHAIRAKEMQMPEATQEVLRNRWQEATVFRASHLKSL
jgi:hypothetical protein